MGRGEPLKDAVQAEIGDGRRAQECEAEGTTEGPS